MHYDVTYVSYSLHLIQTSLILIQHHSQLFNYASMLMCVTFRACFSIDTLDTFFSMLIETLI